MALPLHALPTTLPAAPLARGQAEIMGQTIAVRSLTRAEFLHLSALKDLPDADRAGEIYMIACALDMDEEEAGRWWDESDGMIVQGLIFAIATVSRIPTGDGADPKR